MKRSVHLLLVSCCLSVLPTPAAAANDTLSADAPAEETPGGVDPFHASIETVDAERFIALWRATGGMPPAELLQAEYLQPGSRAIEIFTPGRIVNGELLAARIAERTELYRDAVERCMPYVSGVQGELRSIYLGMRGLLPDARLPRIAVVFGADNSGGTAAPDMQVLGMEVLCRLAPDEASFRALMRHFFAHESVHSLQRIDSEGMTVRQLGLSDILAEGTADYIAMIITGQMPDPDRHAWAMENADYVWREFAADMARLADPAIDDSAIAAVRRRWVGNAGSPPEGWPGELGYWVGMQVARGYVENATDPRAALRELLSLRDPLSIVQASGLAPLALGEGS